MILPTHLARRRLALVLCLGLGPSSSLWAAAADWSCTRGKDGKQWVCDAKPAQSPDTGAASDEASPARARTAEPAPAPRERVRPAESAPAIAEPEAPARTEVPVRRQIPAQAEIPARTVTPAPPEAPAQAETSPALKAPAKAETPAPSAAPVEAETAPRFETPTRPEIAETAPRREPPAAAKPSMPATPPEMKRIPETIEPEPAHAKTAGTTPKTERPGWSCRPGEADESGKGWDCSLVGPDPRGMAHPVAEAGEPTENWSSSATITREDEQRFQKIHSLLPANPWKNVCVVGKRQASPMTEFLLTPADKLAREKEPLEIHSDYFEMVDNEVANFSGGAEMVQADQKLWADFVTRNTVTNALNAHGGVVFQQKGFILSSDTGFMDTDTDRGVFRNSQFILATVPARGTSRVTHLDSSTLSRYETFTYTSCPPGDQDWLLHASHVKINKETGIGTANNAWLEFKGVPMLYTPYMNFPTDDRRLSGFLSPSFAFTRVGGFDFSIPYYFNLAPNYDYTVQPRYLTNRGFLLRNEFRYLTEMTRGRIIGDIMPHDDQAGVDPNNPQERIPTTRGQAGFLNDTRFTENLTAHVDANYVSDSRYLNQLGNALNLVDTRFIRSIGYTNYTGSNYSLRTQVDYFQTIDPTILPQDQPYYHLPQVTFNYANGIADTGLQFQAQAQLDSFASDGGGKTTGQRLKLKPRLYYPFQTAAGFITPSVSLLHNEYWLQDPQYWSQLNNTTTQSSESLTVPTFSLDSGTYFERDFAWGDTPMLQTLEPRLFYVYTPRQKQDDIPVFDSSQYDFTFYQLFRENQFTGSDRVSDANQATAALTSRLVDQSTGRERLRASLGNIFYFQDRQVTLTGPAPASQSESYSNLVGDFYAGLTDNWSFRTGGQWNPERNQVDRAIASLQYNNRQNQLLNIAYRYRRNQYTLTCVKDDPNNGCLDLTDVSFRLPIAEGWHAIGRWQYSLLDQVTLESFLGIERETCCWRFTVLGRHYINNVQSGENQANNGIFVQLELKGLTRLGDEVDSFMERSISGYRYRDHY
jgi:LPS-assembly protein